MFSDSNRLFVKDSRLFIPQETLSLLQQAGLAEDVINAAKQGLVVDNGPHLTEIKAAFDKVLARIQARQNSNIATAC